MIHRQGCRLGAYSAYNDWVLEIISEASFCAEAPIPASLEFIRHDRK